MPQNESNLKTVSILFLLGGLGFFIFFAGIPAINTFVMSLQDYGIIFGMLNSPWVGFANFSRLSSSGALGRMLGNSLILFVLPTLLAVIIAVPMAGAVGGMAKGGRRSLAAALLLLPAFVPDTVLAFLVVSILPSISLANPGTFRLVMVVLTAVRTASVCAFVGACAAGLFNDRGKNILHGAVCGVAIGVAVNVVRFLSSNMELHTMLSNPLVFSTAETFDMFSCQQGLMMMHMSLASASWALKTVLQMLAVVFVSLIVFVCIRTGVEGGESDINPRGDREGTMTGIVPGIVCGLVFVLCLIVPLGFAGVVYGGAGAAIFNSVFTTISSAILFAIPLVMLTLWLCININNKIAVVLILVMLTISNNIVGEFFYFRYFGLTNTRFALILVNTFNITFVLPIAYLTRIKNPKITNISSLVRSMLPYFAIFMGLLIANTWGESFPTLIYVMSSDLWGLPMLLWQAVTLGGIPLSVGMILWIVVPILAIASCSVFVYVKSDV
ncbi:MAG: hypothetical protein FWE11_07045 [Defluviitaleaceae bacterium]|nr:hypothetical protein [Defluviitaleaceae bacterium]